MIEMLDKDELLAMLHKKCTKCGKVKYFGEFSKQNGCAGGIRSQCKQCVRDRSRRWRKANQEKVRENNQRYYEKNREKCIECSRKWREANPEKARERFRKWREANPERVRENNRRWRKDNKERVQETSRKYYEANAEKERERARKYREENREKVIERDRRWYRDNQEKHRKYREENREKIRERSRRWAKENPEKHREKNHRRRARKVNAAGSFTAEQWQARLDYHGNRCIYCGCGGEMTIEHLIPLARGGTNWPANLAPSCKSCNSSKHTKTHFEFLESMSERDILSTTPTGETNE